jgi:quercetin dioxygenase-like cupin family protein
VNEDNRTDPTISTASMLTRRGALLGGAAASLLGLVIAVEATRPDAVAQEATPGALPGYPTGIPAGGVGASVESLNSGAAPGSPGYTLELLRFTFAPGSTVAPHYHAGAQAGWVASGDLAITRVGGLDAVLHRAPSNGTPGPEEQLPLGTETVLHAGDALFDPGSQHWVRNTGGLPCVIYVSALYKDGEKGTTFINPEGTPIP